MEKLVDESIEYIGDEVYKAENYSDIEKYVKSGIQGNDIGTNGVAPGAQLVSIKIFNENGCTTADVVSGLNIAMEQNCQVINMSLGGTGYSEYLNDAIQEAVSKGIIVIASAGNDGDSTINYPASYDGVISVGASGHDYSWQNYSNYNSYVDYVAPGTLVTPAEEGYLSAGIGTSYAAPALSGVAGLLLENNPTLTAQEFENLIHTNTMDLGACGKDDKYGYGVVRVDWLINTSTNLCKSLTVDEVNLMTGLALDIDETLFIVEYSDINKMLVSK